MADEPNDNLYIARDEKGRLLPGSQLGKLGGSPPGSKVTAWRQALLTCVTAEQFTAVWNEMVDMALHGTGKDKREMIHEYLDRVLGKARESIELTHGQPGNLPDPRTLSSEKLAAVMAVLEGPEKPPIIIDAVTTKPADPLPIRQPDQP